jgi:[ribosomal protein S5]-alanine N-acetyltransferase
MDAADEAAFLRAVRSSRKLHRPWSYLPETSASLGHIVFGNLRSAYLGYSAFVPHQRRGFMTEGLELVLRHAFGTLGLHRVEVNVQPDNVRSIALAERLGFRREGYSPRYLKIGGRWRDHVRFAMLADEFSPATTRRRP